MRRRGWGWVLLLAAPPVAAAVSADGTDPCVVSVVERSSSLDPGDLAKVARGEIVVEGQPPSTDRQLSWVGMMRVAAPLHLVRDSLATVRPLAGADHLLTFGLLSLEPVRRDVAAYEVPPGDVDALRRCAVGSCKVKLTLDLLQAYAGLPWNDDGAPEGIHDLARGWLVDYARAYRRLGSAALAVYHDKDEAQSLDEGFRVLLRTSPLVEGELPVLSAHLADFPAHGVPGATDRLSWAVVDFGMRPTTMLSHTVMLERPETVPQVVFAQKHLYASHYLHAGLTVVALIAGVTPDGAPATYVLSYDHFLFDDGIGGIRRLLLRRRLGGHLRRRMEGLRETMEHAASQEDPVEVGGAPASSLACPSPLAPRP